MHACLRLLASVSCAAALVAQNIQTTAVGMRHVDYQPQYGGVVRQSLPVTGSATLYLSGVGTSALTVTPTATTLDLTADSPPWNCYGCWSLAS